MLVRGPTVEIIDVPGAIPGSTRAFGINDTGQIVGTFDVIEQDGLHTHGFLQDTDGSFTRIDVDGARGTQAGGINNSGVIVGTFQDGTGTHGFVRDTDGSFTRIDVDGALETNASGINSSGVIVGTFDVIEQDRLNTHGFIKVGGIFARIDVDGALDTLAFGINSPEGYLSEHLGQIVGWFQDLTGRHGFLRATDGSFTSFDFPSAAQTYAVGINDSGQIVGSFLLDPGRWHGFLRDTDGSLTSFDVPLPGSTDTQLFGINNGGQIVGLFWRGGTRAFTLCGAELTMGPR
jgi:probable HAF family extracellular repeat protein